MICAVRPSVGKLREHALPVDMPNIAGSSRVNPLGQQYAVVLTP